jgi:glycosyltransferase involved in cell wall biosynthesis
MTAVATLQPAGPRTSLVVDSGVGCKADPTLTVVLPAHNEAENIGLVAVGFLRAARVAYPRAEVVVVDDGSTDDTVGALRRHPGGDDPGILVVRHDVNQGYGAALRTGFRAARGRWVFFTDSDGQFSPESLGDFLRVTDGEAVDVIVGYRYPREDRWHRRALGSLWTTVVRAVLGVGARDVNCAFKVMRRRDLERMGLQAQGALINAELLHKAGRLGLVVQERPVRHLARQRGAQSGARPSVVGRALVELARYRLGSMRAGL